MPSLLLDNLIAYFATLVVTHIAWPSAITVCLASMVIRSLSDGKTMLTAISNGS
jgi:hypothetical protein